MPRKTLRHPVFVNKLILILNFPFSFKKRMKQSFEDEENFEDGQYPQQSSEQVRGLLMGLSEMGQI